MSVFPVQRSSDGEDPRFTYGLALDVARVLASHGYPDLTNPAVARGGDLVNLQDALFLFIYGPKEKL
ncbi:hypothetical protein GCM10009827_083940 [Dactylosporangium maewongense]|uniref:Uncharacterized protein n=1 Tax=Dactylosporangium maewongense TaxID=634393 RepID=A0ABN2C165_9ACTN